MDSSRAARLDEMRVAGTVKVKGTTVFIVGVVEARALPSGDVEVMVVTVGDAEAVVLEVNTVGLLPSIVAPVDGAQVTEFSPRPVREDISRLVRVEV